MPKTDEQYIKSSGLQCPSCEAYEVTTVDRVETDDGSYSESSAPGDRLPFAGLR